MTGNGELSAIRESVQLTLEAEGPAGGHGTHEQLDRAIEYYSANYSRFPPYLLFEEVRRCRGLIARMLEAPGHDAARRHLRQVGGWLSALLGNLSLGLLDFRNARPPAVHGRYRTARRAGGGRGLPHRQPGPDDSR